MKHLRKENKKSIKIFKLIILITIIIIVGYTLLGIYKESKIKLSETGEDVKNEINIERIVEIKEIGEKHEKVNIAESYQGFAVSAQLIIPQINLETYILKDFTSEGLNICPSKFWGVEPNEIGNFCIAGHNYQKANMFKNLKKLKIGDEFYLLDNKNGKYTYTIYDIYKVKEDDISPIDEETDGKRIVTLITCVNYTNYRLIVKAVEK